jgi:hypothetical protein
MADQGFSQRWPAADKNGPNDRISPMCQPVGAAEYIRLKINELEASRGRVDALYLAKLNAIASVKP